MQAHFANVFALDGFRADGSQFDRLLDHGERIPLGPLEIEVIATPGHTSDGVTYRIGDALFVGDTLVRAGARHRPLRFPRRGRRHAIPFDQTSICVTG